MVDAFGAGLGVGDDLPDELGLGAGAGLEEELGLGAGAFELAEGVDGACTTGCARLLTCTCMAGIPGDGYLWASCRVVSRFSFRRGRYAWMAGAVASVSTGGGCVSLVDSRSEGTSRTEGSCLTCATSELATVGTANPTTAPQTTRLASERRPR